ncbi:hypothetical protein A0U92_03640 [Acetobacter aceti]|uniref:Bacteriophage Mu Gp45 N-terminal domain-containing protein n=1 Tax=Acetobacter aceti TaxID=435 RepID=A0A1U9KDZ6_ACEAC|nr:phage baseplate assembly protein [Acetobacter aceti]AQS84012.1 hypothetical protein A0U92_03640 [Acetobacter aceti]
MTSPINRLSRRVSMALGIGRQTADTDESQPTPTLQVVLPGGEIRADVPLMQAYGFASRPVPGSDIVVGFLAGDRTRGVAIACGDQRGRPDYLEPGEVAVYHPKTGSCVYFRSDGSMALRPNNKKLEIDADITVNGSLEATGDVTAGSISLESHKHTGVKAGSDETGAPTS